MADKRRTVKGAGTALSASERDALLNSGGAKAENLKPERPDVEQSMLRIKKDEQVQDEILENMSKGLENLKQIGVTIGDEASLHMKLLDNLEDEVDRGNAGLKRETARAEHITRDTKTCWLYSMICLLLVVLIALVAARWA
jgi:hypothetical protein